jgi:hypothetical protein
MRIVVTIDDKHVKRLEHDSKGAEHQFLYR